MVNKKLWAHYERIKSIIGYYITMILFVPFSIFCVSFLIHSKEIDGGVTDAIKIAILNGLEWYAIIMSVVTVLFFIWFLYYSDRVEFTENKILYYRWIFSNKTHEIPYDKITECVFSDGLWKHKGSNKYGRKIWLYNKNMIVLELGIYYKLCLAILLILGDKKIRLSGENSYLKTIDNYFKIDFINLSYEQQLKLLKYYCKLNRYKFKTGEEILKKKSR